MPKGAYVSFVALAICMIGLGVGAEGIAVYVNDAAHTLANPAVYIEAILNTNK